MDIESNKALVRRFYEEIDRGNPQALDELVAEDYVDHNPQPFPGLPPGREGLKQAFRILPRLLPDTITSRSRSQKATRSSPALPRSASTKATSPARRERGMT